MLLELLCCLVVAGFTRGSFEIPDPYDHWDDAHTLLTQLNGTVQNAIYTSTTEIQALSMHLLIFASGVRIETHQQIQKDTAQIRTHIQSLGILADILASAHCVQGREEALDAVSQKIQDDTVDCIAHVTSEAVNMINNATAYIAFAENLVRSFDRRLQECSRETGDVPCLTQLIGEMDLARNEMPTRILDETSRILVLTRTWENGVTECGGFMVGLVQVEGSRMVSEIEICLLGSSTTRASK